jgi:hypothetical protein
VNTRKHDAGVWLAFAAGMFAESVQHSGSLIGFTVSDDEATAGFVDCHQETMQALGVHTVSALKSFQAGKQMMREIRGNAEARRDVPEDGPPNEVPGVTTLFALAGKPDRRLS